MNARTHINTHAGLYYANTDRTNQRYGAFNQPNGAHEQLEGANLFMLEKDQLTHMRADSDTHAYTNNARTTAHASFIGITLEKSQIL